jgi:methionine-rich copper-binding protein CopC
LGESSCEIVSPLHPRGHAGPDGHRRRLGRNLAQPVGQGRAGIDSTVHRSPNRVELWFAERPDLGLTTIRLRLSEDSTKLFKLGEVKAGADPHAAAATVPSPLPPGGYTVVYRTAGVDGHVVRGSYRFTLAK